MLSKFCHSIESKRGNFFVFNSLIFNPIIMSSCEYNNLKNNISLFSVEELDILYKNGILVKDESQDTDALYKMQSIISRTAGSGVPLIYIIPSNYCNLECNYCFIGKMNNNAKIMSAEIIDKIIYEYCLHISKAGIENPTIVFYGGEPLTAFDRIKYTVDLCKKNHLFNWSFAIVTNLTLLNDDMAKFLVDNNFSIGVSIDGPKDVNDKNRIFKTYKERSVYDIVMNNLRYLKEKNAKIGLSITLTEELLNEPYFLDWILQAGVLDINYNLLHFTTKNAKWENYYKKASSFLFESNDVLLPHNIVDDRIHRKIRAFNSRNFKYNDCGAIGGHQLCFSPDGTISVCHGYWNRSSHHCGNIMQESFASIMNKDSYLEWKNNLTIYKQKCLECPAIYMCGGGCAMQSEDLFGDIYGIDEAFCVHTLTSLKMLLEQLE